MKVPSYSMRAAVLLLTIALMVFPVPLRAQQPVARDGEPTVARSAGRIVGRVVDAQTGSGIVNVTIALVGGGLGTMSGVDGRYVLNSVPAGKVAIRAETIGYATKTITAEIGRASCRERV